MIDRCAVYESVYLQDSNTPGILEKAILKLYTAILKFLAKAIELSNSECLIKTR